MAPCDRDPAETSPQAPALSRDKTQEPCKEKGHAKLGRALRPQLLLAGAVAWQVTHVTLRSAPQGLNGGLQLGLNVGVGRCRHHGRGLGGAPRAPARRGAPGLLRWCRRRAPPPRQLRRLMWRRSAELSTAASNRSFSSKLYSNTLNPPSRCEVCFLKV